ncbi:MAG TPA: DinB family protein [Gemmatimonadota bacterium]|nr:DinB family protein [Gemmatimonadota bacterium]
MDFDPAEAIPVLRRTPGVLRTLLDGLSEGWIRADEGPDSWSPFDVVGHLIDGEETDWMVRARIIVSGEEGRRFEPFDRFGHLDANAGRSLAELLDRFAELRAANLAELRELDPGPEELAMTGEHPELGTVTLAQLLATWVTHDLGHIAQVARVMARRSGRAVGPWEAYLPVLRR